MSGYYMVHSWFAWRPVKLTPYASMTGAFSGGWTWLRTVYRAWMPSRGWWENDYWQFYRKDTSHG